METKNKLNENDSSNKNALYVVSNVKGKGPTEKEILIMKLRSIMNNSSGDNKCTICKAVNELEKTDSTGWDGIWMLILLFLIFGGFGNKSEGGLFNDETLLKALTKAIDETRQEKERQNGERT